MIAPMRSINANSFEDVPGARPDAPYVVRSRLKKGGAKIHSPMISAKCVMAGMEEYTAHGRRHVVYPGRFLLTRPGEEFDLSVRESAVGTCLFLEEMQLRQMIGQLLSDDLEGGDESSMDFPTVALPFGASDFAGRFQALAAQNVGDNQYNDDQESDALDLTAALAALLASLSGVEGRLSHKSAARRWALIERLEAARRFLLENAHGKVTLKEIEHAACLSRFHLSRSFALAYGAPPLRYHQNIRLDGAAKRVRAGESLTLIAADLGFSNMSAFSRAYRRRHGRRPSADRRQ